MKKMKTIDKPKINITKKVRASLLPLENTLSPSATPRDDNDFLEVTNCSITLLAICYLHNVHLNDKRALSCTRHYRHDNSFSKFRLVNEINT